MLNQFVFVDILDLESCCLEGLPKRTDEACAAPTSVPARAPTSVPGAAEKYNELSPYNPCNPISRPVQVRIKVLGQIMDFGAAEENDQQRMFFEESKYFGEEYCT